MGRKRGHEEGHANHERWLVSYADFITLLFAFFVVMYSISDLNSKKAKQAANSVRFAMHYAGTGATNEAGVFSGRSSDPSVPRGGNFGEIDQWVREATTVYEFVADEFKEELATSEDSTRKLDERGVVVEVPAHWLFETRSAKPNAKAEKYVTKLLEGARKFHKDVLISGTTARAIHPDDSSFRDSVDLQLARLGSLERMAIEQFQFPADRIEIRSQTKKSVAGGYASPSQVERSAMVELVLKR